MEILAIALAVAFLVIFTMAMGVRIVPQGMKHIVQRLGKYHSTLNPGLNIIIPYIDSVAYKVTTKEIVLDIPAQEVITMDNAVIVANAVTYMTIIDPEKAVYGIEDYSLAIQNLVQTTLRSIIGEMALDDALSSRESIKTKLKNGISDEIIDWGLTVKTVEIQDINPSPTMQRAMEEQAAAERLRRAAVTRAEGEKQAVILEAEGELEASRKNAEAVEILATASANAVKTVTESISKNDPLPAMYLLGERYIESITRLADSENTKTFIYPADIPQVVKGILSMK